MGDLSSPQTFWSCITPVILTYDEAANIRRVLERLYWARDIVVVDSGSVDGTLEVLAEFSNVRCFNRRFDTHASQWNFAVHETGITTEWVLALDADYLLSDGLVSELRTLIPVSDNYTANFVYCVFGQPLRSTLYPPVTILFKKDKGQYIQDGHTQRLKLIGSYSSLLNPVLHDDRKPLSRWLWAQDRYASLEARKILSYRLRQLSMSNRLRRLLVVTPLLVPLYYLFFQRGILDGKSGLYYALQRSLAEIILSLKIVEEMIQQCSSSARHR